MGENPVSKTEGVKSGKSNRYRKLSLDFSEPPKTSKTLLELPLTAKVDSANEDAQLVLSSEHTRFDENIQSK